MGRSGGHAHEGPDECEIGHGLCGLHLVGIDTPHRASHLHSTVSSNSSSHDMHNLLFLLHTCIIRHSQPEFAAKMLRDVVSGYAELSMKGHNAACHRCTCIMKHMCICTRMHVIISQGRVVMAWLSDFVLGFRATLPSDARPERLDEMAKVAFL